MDIRLSKQVLKDIKKETPQVREKLALLISELRQGVVIPYPTSKAMSGHPGLKELRIKDAKGIVRVFYVIIKKEAVYVLHLFRKKSQKTPPKEIQVALKRLKQMRD